MKNYKLEEEVRKLLIRSENVDTFPQWIEVKVGLFSCNDSVEKLIQLHEESQKNELPR